MGRAAKWLRQLLGGKKERERCGPADTRSGPITMPASKEKKRWSFRRSVTGSAMEQKSSYVRAVHIRGFSESDMAAAVSAATAAAASDDAVIRLTNRATETVEEAAAVRIQSFFRSYLARRALCALKGLVKLQALIRGHLVRRQATATLRRVRAMVTAQGRARAHRMRMLDESQRHNNYWRSPQDAGSRESYEMEGNIKIVEMDVGESRSGYAFVQVQAERRDHRLATYSASSTPYKRDPYREASPARFTDRSPRAHSGRYGGDEYSIMQEGSPPPYLIDDSMKSHFDVAQECAMAPSYMANTESSRAKARSHSAPRQRAESNERTPTRRRPSVEGRSVARGALRTQRSASHMVIKLDRSSISLQESECGSTSTLLTNTRSVVSYL